MTGTGIYNAAEDITWFGRRKQGGGGQPIYLTDGLLQPYMKSNQIIVCPSFTGTSTELGYAMNIYGINNRYLDANGSTYWIGVNEAEFEAPAETIMIADGTGNFIGGPGYGRQGTHVRHTEMANTLWQDGHVKAVRVSFAKSSATDIAAGLGTIVNQVYPFDSCATTQNSTTFAFTSTGGATTSEGRCKEDYFYFRKKS